MADSFWVVERFENGRSAGYWDGGHSRSFQPDINEAVQFVRKHDAFWATRCWHWNDTQIVEHGMIAPALPAPATAHSTLDFGGAGKVSVAVEDIVNSPKVQAQVAAVREMQAAPATVSVPMDVYERVLCLLECVDETGLDATYDDGTDTPNRIAVRSCIAQLRAASEKGE